MVQLFPITRGQKNDPQVPVQVTSQAQACEQLTLPHARLPVHVMLQRPPLQVIEPHASSPVQMIVQSPSQWMLPHALLSGQVMLQCMPSGHVNEPPPIPAVIVHVGGEVVGSQLHGEGQLGSSTQ